MYHPTKAEYQPLTVEEEVESESNTSYRTSEDGKEYSKPALPTRCPSILKTLLWLSLSANLSCFLVIALLLQQLTQSAGSSAWYQNASLNPEIKASSFYSPILDQVNMSLSPKPIYGPLFATGDPSDIYRMDPSPEVDAAWDVLTGEGYEVVMISGTDVQRIAKNTTSVVRAPEQWGYGPDAYPVQVDVFHQIHCLNELRKEVHRDYYFNSDGGRKDVSRRGLRQPHLKHCLHILLQNLMCQASADVITHEWIEGLDRPFPDFSITHQCRDFDALLDWVHDNALPDVRVKFNSMVVPEDATRVPMPMPLDRYNGTA